MLSWLRGEQQGCESLALSRTGKAQELGEKPAKAWEARGTRSRIAPSTLSEVDFLNKLSRAYLVGCVHQKANLPERERGRHKWIDILKGSLPSD